MLNRDTILRTIDSDYTQCTTLLRIHTNDNSFCVHYPLRVSVVLADSAVSVPILSVYICVNLWLKLFSCISVHSALRVSAILADSAVSVPILSVSICMNLWLSLFSCIIVHSAHWKSATFADAVVSIIIRYQFSVVSFPSLQSLLLIKLYN